VPAPLTVVIADDHPLFRRAPVSMLRLTSRS